MMKFDFLLFYRTPLERYQYIIRERNKKVEKGIKIKYFGERQD